MKKILAVKVVSAYNVLSRATEEICEGFRNCGYKVDLIDARDSDSADRLIHCLEYVDEYEFFFSMQGVLWDYERTHYPQLMKMTRVTWIMDAPLYHEKRLQMSNGKGAYLLVVQDSYLNKLKARYPKFEGINVLYHGGFNGRNEIYGVKKSIDVFFSGTYTPLSSVEKSIESMGGIFRDIGLQIKDRVVGKNASAYWEDVLRDYLKEIKFEISEEEFSILTDIMRPLDQYQRAYIRKNMIEQLVINGIDVSVVGKGWENYEGEGKEHLRILSSSGVEIDEVIRLMRQSKIVLNCINFAQGVHERIISAMLAKAVCITNEFETEQNFFEIGKDLLTFSVNRLEELPVLVKGVLNDSIRERQIAESGYRIAIQKHTWQHRGEQIIKWLSDGDDFTY